MKSANWISGTGLRPYSAIPIALPMMPASASGVSMTRSAPNSSYRPLVARNTPPNLPMSSPSTTTRSSRRISSLSASLTAWIMFITGIRLWLLLLQLMMRRFRARRLLQLLELLEEVRRHVREHVGKHGLDGRLSRHRLGRLEGGRDLAANLLLQLLLQLGGHEPAPLQVALEAPDRIVVLPLLGLARIPIHRRIVRRRMGAAPVRDRLDQGGARAAARARKRLVHDRYDGQHVVAVDAYAGQPIGHRLGREGPGRGLALARGRDGPAVVAAEKDDRQLEHARKVQSNVERAGRGAALAEVDQRHVVALADLGRVRNPDRLRDLGAHGRRDRNVVDAPDRVVHGHLAALDGILGV